MKVPLKILTNPKISGLFVSYTLLYHRYSTAQQRRLRVHTTVSPRVSPCLASVRVGVLQEHRGVAAKVELSVPEIKCAGTKFKCLFCHDIVRVRSLSVIYLDLPSSMLIHRLD
jgi:hypothetical protein